MTDPKTVLITGASSGFGFGVARDLAARGYNVFASMRGVEGKNAEAAAELPTRSVPPVSATSGVHLAGTVVPQPLPADTGGGAAAEASGNESRADRNTILCWLIGGLSIGLAIALAVVWRRPTTIR